MDEIIRLHIWAQHTTFGGDIYRGEVTDDREHDFFVLEGTREELIADALDRLAHRYDPRPGGAGDAFDWAVARNVLRYLGGPRVTYDIQRGVFVQAPDEDEEDEADE